MMTRAPSALCLVLAAALASACIVSLPREEGTVSAEGDVDATTVGDATTTAVSDACVGPECGRCAATLQAQLEVYLSFEDGADHATDTSGHGRDGFASNVVRAPGRLGQGVAFDGVASVIALSGDVKLEHARTVCAWVRPRSTDGLGQPFVVSRVHVKEPDAPHAGTVKGVDWFGISAATEATGTCGASGTSSPYADADGCLQGPGGVVPDAWSFVCFAWVESSKTLRVYANGASESFGETDLVDTRLEDMTVGANPWGGTSTAARFAGAMDEFALWTRALSPGEMDLLFNGGSGCRIL